MNLSASATIGSVATCSEFQVSERAPKSIQKVSRFFRQYLDKYPDSVLLKKSICVIMSGKKRQPGIIFVHYKRRFVKFYGLMIVLLIAATLFISQWKYAGSILASSISYVLKLKMR